MEVQYELSCFQATSEFTNGTGAIKMKWAELNHAAITVGRKNWDDVYFHQYHSEQEIGFPKLSPSVIRKFHGNVVNSIGIQGVDVFLLFPEFVFS